MNLADPSRNYLLGYHPHGVIAVGSFTAFATEATGFSDLFPGITSHITALVGHFWFPLRREYMMMTGKEGGGLRTYRLICPIDIALIRSALFRSKDEDVWLDLD